MIIKSIKAKNFMRYPEIELKEFPEKGVIGIFGNNECGKSTIGHIISFALFGGTVKATKGEKGQIIRWGEDFCEVELEFSWRNQEYRIYRKIRQSGAQVARLDDMSKGKTVAMGVRDVDDAIHRLLTFDFKGFRYSTYVGQKELNLILDSKVKDRRDVINNMLSINAIEEARAELPAKIKLLESELNSIDTEKNNVESTVKELVEKRQRSDAIKAELKNLENEKKEKNKELEKEKEYLKVLQKYKDISTKISSKNEIIAEKTSEIKEVEKTLDGIQESKIKLQNLEKDIEKYAAIDSELDTKKELRKQFISFKNELENLKKIVSEHKSDVSSRISGLKQQEQGLNDRKTAIERDITEEESIRVNDNEIKRIDAQKNNADKNLRTLAVCAIVLLSISIIMLIADIIYLWFLPLVFAIMMAVGAYYQITKSKKLAQSLKQFEKNRLRLEQRDEHIARYSNEKSQIAGQIAMVNDQLIQLAKISRILERLSFDSFTDLNSDLEMLNIENLSQLSEINNALSSIVSKNYPFINIKQKIIDYEWELNKAIDELSSMAKEKTRLETDMKNCNEVIKKEQETRNRQFRLNQEIRELHDVIVKLQAELPSIEYSEEEYQKTEKLCSNLEEHMRELESELGNAIGQLKTLEKDTSKLSEVQKKLKELERNHATKYRDMQVYEILNDAFTRCQQEIRKRLVPNIEMYFSWILPKITNNRYQKVKVSEDFDIDVFSFEKNDFVNVSNLSGGTEDQLLLSLRLAFAKALTPEGIQFFLFLDEPISSFDEQRRSSFLDFLKLLETSFQQIFLISHLTGLEDFVDNFIRIEDTAEGIPQVSCSWI